MDMKEFLTQFGQNPTSFGRLSQTTANIINRVLKGQRITKRSAKLIKKHTNGLVDYQKIREIKT